VRLSLNAREQVREISRAIERGAKDVDDHRTRRTNAEPRMQRTTTSAAMAAVAIPKPPHRGTSVTANATFATPAATIALSLYVNTSWMGFAFRAVAEDEDAAATLAINGVAYKLTAFALGTAFAGLAGGLYAYFTQFINVDAFDFITSVMIMAMVVIGGIGSTFGVAIAAVALTLLPETFRFINEYRLLVFGGLLVLFISLAPGGLASLFHGTRTRLRR
jgi:branched-chain amino acid transport system permease protein